MGPDILLISLPQISGDMWAFLPSLLWLASGSMCGGESIKCQAMASNGAWLCFLSSNFHGKTQRRKRGQSHHCKREKTSCAKSVYHNAAFWVFSECFSDRIVESFTCPHNVSLFCTPRDDVLFDTFPFVISIEAHQLPATAWRPGGWQRLFIYLLIYMIYIYYPTHFTKD